MADSSSINHPVEDIDTKSVHRGPPEGIALCLSGGGYRAMVFHVGMLWRLNEFGLLPKLDRISSVSGGSITAAALGLGWAQLGTSDDHPVSTAFEKVVVEPIRRLASKSIDAKSVIFGGFGPGSISDKIEAAYRKILYGDATLQDLPDSPRFVINATNVQSGALWRFMKPYMRDWRVGEVRNPTVSIALAVTASSAFPPILSPCELDLEDSDFTPKTGHDLQRMPYTTDVVLTDGGVYDNLGLETAWKRYSTIFVSDAGGKTQPEADPKHDWARHSYRVFNIIDNQVRSLRKRQLIGSYKNKGREGAYWGIRTNIENYGLSDAMICPFKNTLELANVPTRLKRLDQKVQDRLINWGYAVSDAAIRKHYRKELMPPKAFPYPDVGV